VVAGVVRVGLEVAGPDAAVAGDAVADVHEARVRAGARGGGGQNEASGWKAGLACGTLWRGKGRGLILMGRISALIV
jgi:hypothetical protein